MDYLREILAQEYQNAIDDFGGDANDKIGAAEIRNGVNWSIGSNIALSAMRSLQGDYEKVIEEHKRLVRELDAEISFPHDAARQASLCDLIGTVKPLHDNITTLQSALRPFSGQPENGEAETSVPDDSPVTIRCHLGDVRRARAALSRVVKP